VTKPLLASSGQRHPPRGYFMHELPRRGIFSETQRV
jgi:hypothetical protein